MRLTLDLVALISCDRTQRGGVLHQQKNGTRDDRRTCPATILSSPLFPDEESKNTYDDLKIDTNHYSVRADPRQTGTRN